ncbi:MAG: hypothetical protein FWJ93_08355 [Micromonosporaceae bacterium]
MTGERIQADPRLLLQVWGEVERVDPDLAELDEDHDKLRKGGGDPATRSAPSTRPSRRSTLLPPIKAALSWAASADS